MLILWKLLSNLAITRSCRMDLDLVAVVMYLEEQMSLI